MEGREPKGAVLVKLGGSVITDKRRPRAARLDALGRLATEIAAAREAADLRLVAGHGSGSFGHVAAAEYGIREGVAEPSRVQGVAVTQRQAAELHRLVLVAFEEAGLPCFSWAPSSAVMTDSGHVATARTEPVWRALTLGLLPVVYGDVVMDRAQGASICSTETVFSLLIASCKAHETKVERVLWLGDTEGILDPDGNLVEEITPATAEGALSAVAGSAATDVTGGMRHRLETCLALARLGIPSWIGNGTAPGRAREALLGEAPGTRVSSG